MISYRIAEQDLLAKIDAFDSKWRAKAKAATAACAAAGKYVKADANGKEIDGLWSEIKEVFMDLQHTKCCYCERRLASKDKGKAEHDIEHYRPKSRVKNWFTAAVKKGFADWPTALGQSGAFPKGYHLLAFDPLNYSIACKECNSGLKSDYFPCGSAVPLLEADSPAAAGAEDPWLIFPFGDGDERAESLIQFDGILAQPVHEMAADPRRHWRARITIRFFQLNVPNAVAAGDAPGFGRENLYRERAEAISDLASTLDSLERATTPAQRLRDEKKIRRSIADDSTHVNCRRGFLRLWTEPATRPKALEIWEEVERYLNGETA
jgi:hypothetical protein